MFSEPFINRIYRVRFASHLARILPVFNDIIRYKVADVTDLARQVKSKIPCPD